MRALLRDYQRELSAVAILALLFVVVLVTQVEHWAALLPQTINASATRHRSDSPVSLAQITQTHLFGKSPGVRIHPSVAGDLQLKGIMWVNPPMRPQAMIKLRGQSERLVHPGEQLTPTLRVISISPAGVLLKRQGHLEHLSLPKRFKPTPDNVANNEPKSAEQGQIEPKIADPDRALRKRFLDRLREINRNQ